MSEKQGRQEQCFVFLDRLRKSSVTNMFGATPYLMAEFGLERGEARAILLEWMETFAARHGQGENT